MATSFEFSLLSAEHSIANRNLPRAWFYDGVFRGVSCESMGSPRLHIDSQLDIAIEDRVQQYSRIVTSENPLSPSIAAPEPESPRERPTALPASPVDLGSIDEKSFEEVYLLSAASSQETSKPFTFDDVFGDVVDDWESLENSQNLMESTIDEEWRFGSSVEQPPPTIDRRKAWSLSLAAENELSGSFDTIVDDDPLFKAPSDISKLDPVQIVQIFKTHDVEAVLTDFDWENFGAHEGRLQPQRLEYEDSAQPGICNF
ncbi:hypothetical protein CcaCcLH18_14091 [Colletotrichum camelliae]|nr:hypothetical protein CcaCcLH18_14091 [Colletotrichum camelliae]